jgi:AraC-like DNA-binding protein
VLGQKTRERVVEAYRYPELADTGLHEVLLVDAGEFLSLHRDKNSLAWALVTLAGSGRVTAIGDEDFAAEPGAAALMPAGVRQSLRAGPGGWRYILVTLRPAQLPLLRSFAGERAIPIDVEGFAALCEALWHEVALAAQRETGGPDLKPLSELVVRKLVRLAHPRQTVGRLAGVWRLVEESPAEPWSLALLARHAGLARERLRALCQRDLGVSPMSHVTELRMRAAARLLDTTDLPVELVSERVGYASARAFHAAFRRVFGESPGRHRAHALAHALETKSHVLRPKERGAAVPTGTDANIGQAQGAAAVAAAGFVDPPTEGWNDWKPLDLAPYVNRDWRGRGRLAWFGKPLQHLRPGRRSYRGIPFAVLDSATHEGRAIVMLRSQAETVDIADAPLPEHVRMPLGQPVRHLAWLHGGGWIRHPTRLGLYRVIYADSTSLDIQVEGLGNTALLGVSGQRANIQDWYFSYEQFRRPGIFPVNLAPPRDPLATAEYLYVWCWENPRPTIPVVAVEVRSALETDPACMASLALVALSWR